MAQSQTLRIQSEAAEALAEWKAFFAQQVAEQAKVLANRSNPPGLITRELYRQAATLAVQALATALQDTGPSDGRQEAA